MNRTIAIVLQVLGYECMLAMITTIRIENTVVFDVPFPARAGIGIIGMVLVIVGAFGLRRLKNHETKPETQLTSRSTRSGTSRRVESVVK